MKLEKFKEKLKSYSKEDIIFTNHAKLQAILRDVYLEDVKNDVINPFRLVYIQKQDAKFKGEEKYDCYFAYSKHACNQYALTINGKVIIVTIIKINRDWQRAIG
ncbi:hypothetical protein J4411_02420 [Candidatus Pacearchaeota archaeon]|nr:hypothetical protein [Candidatus Pacearchaeota archaeon]